ncbi:MAG: hypothetical protein JEY94_12025 [Melioribacteraceae bacterium]|nr:hypothetical protein [Melioribacteraceae bacterium]
MKNLLFIILFSSINLFSQEFILKPEFDSLLVAFVDSAKELYEQSNTKKVIKRDPYESSDEYKIRVEEFKDKLEKKFYALKLKQIEDFYKENSKTYKILINIDSVRFDADKQLSKLYFEKIKIPHNMGIPMITAYVAPVFTLPDTWTAKEGFGFEMIDVSIKRSLAKENDIIKNKGRLEVEFALGEENLLPTMTLKQLKWRNEDIYLWTWKGNATIPKSDLRGLLKGKF